MSDAASIAIIVAALLVVIAFGLMRGDDDEASRARVRRELRRHPIEDNDEELQL